LSHEEPGRGYIRAVEAAWSKMVGRPTVVSPREFAAVDDWRRRGIPLAVVLEALGAAGKRSGRPPKSLTALARAVEEAYAVVASGRIATAATPSAPARSDARRAWESALTGCRPDAPLYALLTRLLADEANGVPASQIDAVLDESLPRAVSESQLAGARAETLAALAPFRPRMSEDEFRSTLARALAERLRVMLALPRLSLTR
jgi:hypothetical protein